MANSEVCYRHYPKTSFTSVADTPENLRLKQQSKMQSQVTNIHTLSHSLMLSLFPYFSGAYRFGYIPLDFNQNQTVLRKDVSNPVIPFICSFSLLSVLNIVHSESAFHSRCLPASLSLRPRHTDAQAVI